MLVRGPRLLTRFRLPAALVALTLLYGTLGYLLLEGWSLTDALYMTVTTLATVGYGEVRPLDPSGKLFTISLIVLGVVALAASIDAVAGALVSGELQAAIRRRRMRKRLDHLQAHYVVCAYGRVGRAAVAELRAEGVPVLVVEPKPELAELLEEHGVPHLPADPTEETALQQAGIQRARGLLCAMDSDAANVFITLTARALNPALTIVARAANPASVDKLLRAGADHVVSPYDVSGRHMGVLALHPAIVDFLDMAKLAPGLRLEEIEVRTGSPLPARGWERPGLATRTPSSSPASRRATPTSPCLTTTPSWALATWCWSLARSRPSRRWPGDRAARQRRELLWLECGNGGAAAWIAAMIAAVMDEPARSPHDPGAWRRAAGRGCCAT
jgi:voltage-gated potassium channel